MLHGTTLNASVLMAIKDTIAPGVPVHWGTPGWTLRHQMTPHMHSPSARMLGGATAPQVNAIVTHHLKELLVKDCVAPPIVSTTFAVGMDLVCRWVNWQLCATMSLRSTSPTIPMCGMLRKFMGALVDVGGQAMTVREGSVYLEMTHSPLDKLMNNSLLLVSATPPVLGN